MGAGKHDDRTYPAADKNPHAADVAARELVRLRARLGQLESEPRNEVVVKAVVQGLDAQWLACWCGWSTRLGDRWCFNPRHTENIKTWLEAGAEATSELARTREGG